MHSCQVVIVGSGFAGTILARILHKVGVDVVLVERSHHPRFAIGESSTPLAAICLERLAARYELPDLAWLAAHGRWLEHIPQVRRGLKRGFTFYAHRSGEEFQDSPRHEGRLLVAASPDDAVADSHWLRADVDHFLVQQAVREGVDYRDELEVRSLRREAESGWRLMADWRGATVELSAPVLIDASGAGGFLARTLPLESRLDEVGLDTALVFSHFDRLGPFVDLEPGPYPDQNAAVHHLIAEGWVYVLPFDHGVASAGLVLRRRALAELTASGIETPEAIWETVLQRYPSLWTQFSAARPVMPLVLQPRVQRLLNRAAGRDWALLPHGYAVFDPMFSTGIAWSLIAVERLAGALEKACRAGRPNGAGLEADLTRYDALLCREAGQIEALLEGAFAALDDFELFVAQSYLYFSLVSHAEVGQRLHPEGRGGRPPAWQGFLGAGEEHQESLFREARRRLVELAAGRGGVESASDGREDFRRWILASIADRNIVGLGDPGRHNFYPVDLDLLVERADLLGLSREEMRSQLPKLRGTVA